MVNMPSSIVDLSEFDEHKNVMVYGPSGVGKTVWAGTAPSNLFLASEKGTISAKRLGSDAKVWPIHSWVDFEEALKWLKTGGYKKFKTVTVDSMTSNQDILWRHTLNRAVQDNPSRDPDLPAIQEHYKVQNVMKRIATDLCDLPVDTIFTALPMATVDEEGEDLSLPQINGKQGDIAQFVMGQMSAVGHMVSEENDDGKRVRRIYWEHSPPHYGKDRYNCLAPYTEGLTVPKIWAKIEASGTEPRAARGTRRAGTTRRRSTRRVAN